MIFLFSPPLRNGLNHPTHGSSLDKNWTMTRSKWSPQSTWSHRKVLQMLLSWLWGMEGVIGQIRYDSRGNHWMDWSCNVWFTIFMTTRCIIKTNDEEAIRNETKSVVVDFAERLWMANKEAILAEDKQKKKRRKKWNSISKSYPFGFNNSALLELTAPKRDWWTESIRGPGCVFYCKHPRGRRRMACEGVSKLCIGQINIFISNSQKHGRR